MKKRHIFRSRRKERNEPALIDPSIFQDPVAEETSWNACRAGGSSFRTHTLAQDRPDQLRFKASLGAILFALIFFLVGMGALGFGLKISFSADADGEGKPWLLFLVGLIFAAVGVFMWWKWLAPITFDKTAGFYWKGRQKPHRSLRADPTGSMRPLKAIHAVQLIRERVTSSSSRGGGRRSFLSYEINLVLEDGSRWAVVDHGSEKAILRQAEQLSAFLAVPLWRGY